MRGNKVIVVYIQIVWRFQEQGQISSAFLYRVLKAKNSAIQFLETNFLQLNGLFWKVRLESHIDEVSFKCYY